MTRGIRAVISLSFAWLGGGALAGCADRLPTSTELEDLDVARAEQVVSQLNLLSTAGPTGHYNVHYVVDGARVTADEAHRLTATRLAEVRVRSIAEGELAVEVVTRDPVPGMSNGFAVITPDAPTLIIDGHSATLSDYRRLAPSDILSIEVTKGGADRAASTTPRSGSPTITIRTRRPD